MKKVKRFLVNNELVLDYSANKALQTFLSNKGFPYLKTRKVKPGVYKVIDNVNLYKYLALDYSIAYEVKQEGV